MLKKITCVAVASLMLSSVFISGCKKKEDSAVKTAYDSIKLSDYVTLGDYKGIELDYAPSASEAEVNKEVENKLINNAELNKITDRAIKEDDTVCMYFTGYVDGVENEQCTVTEEEASEYDFKQRSFIPGFLDAIVGKMPGEQIKTSGLTFPEDYEAEDLAGKPVEFEIIVQYIAEYTVPELTDETVLKISEGALTTVEAFVSDVKTKLEKTNAEKILGNSDENKWKIVVDNATVIKYPESEKEYYINYYNEYFKSYADQYEISLKAFAENMLDYSMDEYNSYIEKNAETSVKSNLVAAAIAEKENIAIKSSDYQSELEALAEEQSYESVEEFKTVYDDETIYKFLLQQKVIDFIVSNSVDKNMPSTEPSSEN